ncbi:MAG: hypothetical protein JWO87_4019, partial [Phycisphaerales bacterium]|nr:hypothetical protein [Phycisphaerales bacterium]
MAKRQHKHLIDVRTDEEIVTVTIGNDGGVPGGFAKLFNRVVDSEAWARLSDAGRAAYLPLVRFADHRNQFRVRVGQAAIMKYGGLSRSSAKRAMKDLVANKLIVIVDRGGVSAAGENESNTYQLLVPAEYRPRTGGGPVANPPGVLQRTPSRTPIEPPARPAEDRVEVPVRTAAGVPASQARGAAGEPLLRRVDKEHSKTPSSGRLATEPNSVERAAALLEEKGVERAASALLAEAYPYQRIVDVIATMEWRKSRGKCENPGGFIRDALVKQWQTPRTVTEARTRAEARLRAEAAERETRATAVREQAQVGEEESRVERLIASLDDEELQILAGSVMGTYEGNAAVTAELTRTPPRASRLMKMEIAAMLAGGRERVGRSRRGLR